MRLDGGKERRILKDVKRQAERERDRERQTERQRDRETERETETDDSFLMFSGCIELNH